SENLGEIQARETVVERRVRANVIRRRTSRVEVVPQAGEKAEAEVEAGAGKTAAPAIEETTAPIAPAADSPEGPGAALGIPADLAGEMEAAFQEEPPSAE